MTPKEILAKAGTLHPVSQTALKLAASLEKPDVGNHEIIEIVKHDPVLTAKLLRLCNSSFAGVRIEVVSVDEALLILGHSSLSCMVMALGFGRSLSSPLPGYSIARAELWRHSIISAFAADILARELPAPGIEPSAAFTGALLHDIGKVVLHQALPPAILQAIRSRIEHEGLSRLAAERDLIQTDHAEIGAQLLQEWNLPASIVNAVANHHRPLLRPRPQLCAFTHLADCLAHLAGSAPGWEGYTIETYPDAAQALGATQQKIEKLLLELQECAERINLFAEAA